MEEIMTDLTLVLLTALIQHSLEQSTEFDTWNTDASNLQAHLAHQKPEMSHTNISKGSCKYQTHSNL